MALTRMDYDATEIPLAYDRGRTHGREVMDLWMRTVETMCSFFAGKSEDAGIGPPRCRGNVVSVIGGPQGRDVQGRSLVA